MSGVGVFDDGCTIGGGCTIEEIRTMLSDGWVTPEEVMKAVRYVKSKGVITPADSYAKPEGAA